MKKLLLVVMAFLSVVSAWAAGGEKHTNFLAGTFRFGSVQSVNTDPDLVVLDTLFVTGRTMKISENIARSLERSLDVHSEQGMKLSDRKYYFVLAGGSTLFNGLTDSEKYIAQRELAQQYLGGVELFKNGTFYFHGGLMRRINNNMSFGLKSFHGAKGPAYEIRW